MKNLKYTVTNIVGKCKNDFIYKEVIRDKVNIAGCH